MGACASHDAVNAGGAAPGRRLEEDKGETAVDHPARAGSARADPEASLHKIQRQLDAALASNPGAYSTGSTGGSGVGSGWTSGSAPRLINKVHVLQQEVAMLSNQPLLALSEAVELLVQQMEVDFAGICAYAEDEDDCALLLALHGAGAATMERHAVMRGRAWSAARLVGAGAPTRVYVGDAGAAAPAAPLPADFELLHREAGMTSFMAVAIGPRGRPFGALLMGRRGAHAFDDKWSSIWPTAVATGLLCHLRPALVARIVRQLQTIDMAGDPVSAISAALQSGACFMATTVNARMGMRLAVLDPEAPDAALVFESARAVQCAGRDGGGGGGGGGRSVSGSSANGKSIVLPSDPQEDVTVREMPLAHTLLASAIQGKKARFVKDCAAYMQNCPEPAHDVFTHASHLVSSLVVVPLIVEGRALGALYFTQDTPCDFSNIQDALLGFVQCVTLPLHNKLSGQMDTLRGMVKRLSTASRMDLIPSAVSSNLMQLTGSDTDEDTIDYQDAPRGPPCPTAGLSAVGVSARLSKVSSRQLCTEAMLKVLQQEIRKGRRRSVELLGCEDLVVSDSIGRGGFGSVYSGTWHTIPAAIKVMNARSSNSEAVSDAMEMAVLSSVQHPNIVQVYACLTDMVAVEDTWFDSASSYPAAADRSLPPQPRFRRLLPGEQLDAPTFNIIVMERMDRGTLHEAVRAGAFHQEMETGDIGVDLGAVVDILLAVAHSLQYLHSISLLHGDVKLDNVLLKSEPTRPLGVAPKLADFGLTKILREDDQVLNFRGAGTVTHMPPEMFQAGTRVTTAVDAYAFGVMMWEFYTARRAWSGLSRDAIIDQVYRRNRRPAFPPGAPAGYVSLAAACWAAAPADRPAFGEAVAALQRMAAEAREEPL
ncbi:MAG: kinase-like domain-containing protein [Monoraphidium minutum]|nr:MAG: kinase-like domain-containing protein [Monoraphidium minutum]